MVTPGSTVTPPGAEREVESDYASPVATGNFVWIANPKSGRVAFVDAVTLEVRTALAGQGPTYLAKVPGPIDDTTLVLNVGSGDATLLHADKGAIAAKTLMAPHAANSLTFSPDGHYAIAWADGQIPGAGPMTVWSVVKSLPWEFTLGYGLLMVVAPKVAAVQSVHVMVAAKAGAIASAAPRIPPKIALVTFIQPSKARSTGHTAMLSKNCSVHDKSDA